MREISASLITYAIEKLCIKANKQLPCDIENCLHNCAKNETNPLGRSILCDLEKKLEAEAYPFSYELKYGLNFFPEKIYKGVKYEEGYYESLLITLGEGEGNNWWCVLFPPLCIMEAEESDEVEYKFFIQEIIEKINTF